MGLLGGPLRVDGFGCKVFSSSVPEASSQLRVNSTLGQDLLCMHMSVYVYTHIEIINMYTHIHTHVLVYIT